LPPTSAHGATRGHPRFLFDPDRRWYAKLPLDEAAEAWLLSWLPGQGTGLHDHGDTAGVFVVVEGELRETSVTPRSDGGMREIVRTFTSGQARVFGSQHVHDVVNTGPMPAVSLHVYAPALTTMRRYRKHGDLLMRTAVERAGRDW
jgi:predicted metal-dependent enzyme (double-stranded beta helix superfamily)